MVNISNNLNINQPIQVYNSNAKTDNEIINNDSPKQPSNLIEKYLSNLALQNKPTVKNNVDLKPLFTPTFDGYNNMVQKDENGNIVQEVKYSKDGNKIIQDIFVQCYDGSKFNQKKIKDGNKKTMEIDFKDKDGNSIIKESRSYEKIDDDNAISIHNGKEYKISGLKGHVITIEHDGQKNIIDFDKKVNSDTENINEEKTGKKITPEQKDFLINRIKYRSGDIILDFDKKINNLTLLDIDDYEGYYNHGALKTCPKADYSLELHELGHGVSVRADGTKWTDDNSEYLELRENEINNFKNSVRDEDFDWRMQKFTTCDYFIKDGMSPENAKKQGANEEFAETYSLINNIDIEDISYRTTSLIQYMPKSTVVAYKTFKND